MKVLRDALDKMKDKFEGEGSLAKFYPIYEMIDTFLYTTNDSTKDGPYIRDGLDLKRVMSSVAIALMPCILMAMYNTGYQANQVISSLNSAPGTWQFILFYKLGFTADPNNIIANFVHGALYFIPVFLVTNMVGGFWEVVFSIVRKHEINEGFLVTGLLFPLTLPPTIPLWQVAVGISFGVVFGKEIFGGTGKNFLNPALTARAFLFFAYPAQISGDAVWVAVDGYTGATALAQAANGGVGAIEFGWMRSFLGLIPGSMGETSAFAALLGAAYLCKTGMGSWRIMSSVFIGMVATVLLFNFIGSETNPMFALGPEWHFVLGGFAFGMVFMATDPISAAMTEKGQIYYGLLIGFMVALIRVINPAFPEGMMLAILFGNVFAPLIDHFVMKSHIKRRKLRHV